MCKSRQLIPFFDIAYQGFSSGDLDADAWAIRYFAHDAKHEIFVAQSFSKNFSLYNERIGHLTAVFDSPNILLKFRSQMATIIRRSYSNPPAHGAYIVSTILNNATLYHEWQSNVRTMYERIATMRRLFYSKLKQLGTPGSWEHIMEQTGENDLVSFSPFVNSAFFVRYVRVYRLESSSVPTLDSTATYLSAE